MIVKQILSTASGELSQRLSFRNDFGKYDSGCRVLENFISTPHGAAIKRPGTDLICDLSNTSSTGKLVAMQISSTEHCVLAMCGGVAYVIANGEQVATFVIPWTDVELSQLKWRQVNDVIFFTHQNHHPMVLARVSDTEWYLNEVPFGAMAPLLSKNADENIVIAVNFPIMTPAWSSSHGIYYVGDRVSLSGKVYVCHSQHTASALNGPTSGAVYSKVLYDNRGVPYLSNDTAPVWTEVALEGASATGQEVVISCNTALFRPDHVGSTWRIESDGDPKTYEATLEATSAQDGKYSTAVIVQGSASFTTFGTWYGTYALERSEDDGATWTEFIRFSSTTVAPRNVSHAFDEQNRTLVRIKWIHVSAGSGSPYGLLACGSYRRNGYVKITSVAGDGKSCTAQSLTQVELGTTSHFYEGAFSERQGYPRCVEIHQGRILYAGTALAPHTVWGSAYDDFNNFIPGTDADSSWRHQIMAGERDPILWMLSDERLIIGTGSAEFVMAGSSESKPITAEDRSVRRISSYGTDDRGVGALLSESVPVFIQRGGDRILDTSYDNNTNSYQSSNVCIMADHLHRSKVIVDMAIQKTPIQIIWCVTDDGKLTAHTYERQQQVAGWHRHSFLAGSIKAVCCCRGENAEDYVYFIVEAFGKLSVVRLGRGGFIEQDIDGTWTDMTVKSSNGSLAESARFNGSEVFACWGGKWWAGVWESSAWSLLTGYFLDTSEPWGGKYYPAGTHDNSTRFVKVGHETLGELADQIFSNGGTWEVWSAGSPVAVIGDGGGQPENGDSLTTIAGSAFAGTVMTITENPVLLGRDVTWSSVVGNFWATEVDGTGNIVYRHCALERTMQYETYLGIQRWTQRAYQGMLIFHATTGNHNLEDVTWVNSLTNTAASGSMTFIGEDHPAIMRIGLPVVSTYEPMPLTLQMQNGTSRSREMRVHSVVVDLEDSYGGKFGETVGNTYPIHADSAKHSGEKEISFFGGYNMSGDLFIVADAPAPFILRGLVVKFNVYGDGN